MICRALKMSPESFQHNTCQSEPSSLCCSAALEFKRWDKLKQRAVGFLTSYLVEQQVKGAIAHVFCDYAEELGFVADAQNLDDVVESGLVEHLCLLQQTVPLPEIQTVCNRFKLWHKKVSVSQCSFCNLGTMAI